MKLSTILVKLLNNFIYGVVFEGFILKDVDGQVINFKAITFHAL